MDWVDKPQNYKDLHGILQTLRGSHLNNFPRKTLKLRWGAFHSLTFQLKCLDFQSNQYKKLVPVLSRFCNWLLQLLCLCYRPCWDWILILWCGFIDAILNAVFNKTAKYVTKWQNQDKNARFVLNSGKITLLKIDPQVSHILSLVKN